MASSRAALQIAPRNRNPNPACIRFFSSSSDYNDADGNTPPPPPSSSSSSSSSSFLSSYFKDLKSSLKQPPQPPRQSSSVASFSAIEKNPPESRARYSAPDPSPSTKSSSSAPISYQELFKYDVFPKPEGSPPGNFSFGPIRESLRKMRPPSNSNATGQNQGKSGLMSLSDLQNSLRLRPESGVDKSSVVTEGSNDAWGSSLFGKDSREKNEADVTKKKSLKPYSMTDLGDKLRTLRPEMRGETWFSLNELNERLMKLIEMDEEEEKNLKIGGFPLRGMKELLLNISDEKKPSSQKMKALRNLGRTSSFMLSTPKEQLVEQYYHPDNMSSAEKLKIDLKKVRDEFKMSESDCGSARVQVAQLTTKIKHLTSVLHKKDKHSQKGLQAMVQRRKKLLKYLRRTDWDSYCLVLSKLGLRDHPNYRS